MKIKDPIKRRLRRLTKTNRYASEFLLSLDEILGYFDRDFPPDYSLSDFPSGLDESRWKALSYFIHTCRDWRSPNDPFPREFTAVQPAPVEMCDLIESNAHWLCWILSQKLLYRCCEAIIPGCHREYGDEANYIELTEDDYTKADWWIVCDAVHLKWGDNPDLVNGDVVRRLNALIDQEYERAIKLVKSEQTADGKTDGKKNNKNSLPANSKVIKLSNRINAGLKPGEKMIDIAREIATEGDITPESLTRKYREYRNSLQK